MKRTVVLLCFLLLVVVTIFGTGNIAFAEKSWTPPAQEVAIVVCVGASASPFNFIVTYYDGPVLTPPITPSPTTDCATSLEALKEAGLVIRSVQALNTSPISVVYTLVSGK